MVIHTMAGMVTAVKGHFRPYLFVTYPKNIFPNKQPIHNNDAIQEASSIDILPQGNGLLSDVRRKTAGLVHPSEIPNAVDNKFTV